MIYKALKQQRFEYLPYAIVPIRMVDMSLIKDWRNAQLTVLRQKELLTEDVQRFYFNSVVTKLFDEENPKQILVSYLKNDLLIGYGGLVHIDWLDKRAEVSFLLDPIHVADSATYRIEFSVFLSLVKQLAFKELALNRLFTETFDIRELHVSVLEANGFLFEGRMRKHVLINSVFYDSLIHGCLRQDENI